MDTFTVELSFYFGQKLSLLYPLGYTYLLLGEQAETKTATSELMTVAARNGEETRGKVILPNCEKETVKT
jgi:hypothetical protein